MALTRIKFNDSASSSGAYILTLNPGSLEMNVDTKHNLLNVLDGTSVIQDVFFDNRAYVLKWFKIPNDLSGFSSMIATLNSYRGKIKYVNFQDIDYRISATGWIKTRVSNFKVEHIQTSRGGKLKYNVEMVLIPEQQ